jgi:uncharacterized membrane protein YoaK (UPF0700 family)
VAAIIKSAQLPFHSWLPQVMETPTPVSALLHAGIINAGGFLAVGQYTSHMTGVVSSIADALVLGHVVLALGSLSMLLAFLGGAMCTAVLVNWGLRRALRSAYGLPLLLESLLLMNLEFQALLMFLVHLKCLKY